MSDLPQIARVITLAVGLLYLGLLAVAPSIVRSSLAVWIVLGVVLTVVDFVIELRHR